MAIYLFETKNRYSIFPNSRRPWLVTSLITRSLVKRVPAFTEPWSLERFLMIIDQFLWLMIDLFLRNLISFHELTLQYCGHWIHDTQKFERRAIFKKRTWYIWLLFYFEKMFERLWKCLLVAAHPIAVIHTKYKLDFKYWLLINCKIFFCARLLLM